MSCACAGSHTCMRLIYAPPPPHTPPPPPAHNHTPFSPCRAASGQAVVGFGRVGLRRLGHDAVALVVAPAGMAQGGGAAAGGGSGGEDGGRPATRRRPQAWCISSSEGGSDDGCSSSGSSGSGSEGGGTRRAKARPKPSAWCSGGPGDDSCDPAAARRKVGAWRVGTAWGCGQVVDAWGQGLGGQRRCWRWRACPERLRPLPLCGCCRRAMQRTVPLKRLSKRCSPTGCQAPPQGAAVVWSACRLACCGWGSLGRARTSSSPGRPSRPCLGSKWAHGRAAYPCHWACRSAFCSRSSTSAAAEAAAGQGPGTRAAVGEAQLQALLLQRAGAPQRPGPGRPPCASDGQGKGAMVCTPGLWAPGSSRPWWGW
jgi:hypothetical protein